MSLTLLYGLAWLLLHLAGAAPSWAFDGLTVVLLPLHIFTALALIFAVAALRMSEGLEPR